MIFDRIGSPAGTATLNPLLIRLLGWRGDFEKIFVAVVGGSRGATGRHPSRGELVVLLRISRTQRTLFHFAKHGRSQLPSVRSRALFLLILRLLFQRSLTVQRKRPWAFTIVLLLSRGCCA